MVRYTISDGKISYLDTGKTGEEGKLREFAAGTSFLLRDNGIMRLTTNDAGTKYRAGSLASKANIMQNYNNDKDK